MKKTMATIKIMPNNGIAFDDDAQAVVYTEAGQAGVIKIAAAAMIDSMLSAAMPATNATMRLTAMIKSRPMSIATGTIMWMTTKMRVVAAMGATERRCGQRCRRRL